MLKYKDQYIWFIQNFDFTFAMPRTLQILKGPRTEPLLSKTYFSMKNILCFLLIAYLSCQQLFSQSNWGLSGNSASSGSYLGTTNQYPLIFKVGGTEKLRLTTSGDVGIGTTTPEAKLDVNGTLCIHDDLRLRDWYDPNMEEPRLILFDEMGVGYSRTYSNFLADLHSASCSEIGADFQPAWQSTLGNSTNNSKLFTGDICPTNVGIGTDDPISTLSVIGDTYMTEGLFVGASPVSSIKLLVMADQMHGLLIKFEREVGEEYFPLRLMDNTTSNDVFKVNDEGRVSIQFFGVATDDMFNIKNDSGDDLFAITSEGICYSQGMVIKYAPFFPDYVFENGYELMSLL